MSQSYIREIRTALCGGYIKMLKVASHQWLTPVILHTQEAEIRRIMA
jgi:hypothetical protein